MNETLQRPTDRAAQYIRAALLQPDQVDDVVLAQREAGSKSSERSASAITHAHGDFGHADR